jgi:hypothetical protein
MFHGTHIQLRNWFLVIALMLNAKKSASSCQIARDLGMRQPTVWAMMHRIRVAMASDEQQSGLLHGIVEADETYVGGKPRKGNHRDGDQPNKRGRGTKKVPVIGVAERYGRVGIDGRMYFEAIGRPQVQKRIIPIFYGLGKRYHLNRSPMAVLIASFT